MSSRAEAGLTTETDEALRERFISNRPSDFETVLFTVAEMLDGPTALSARAWPSEGRLVVYAGGLGRGGLMVLQRRLRERFPITIDIEVQPSP